MYWREEIERFLIRRDSEVADGEPRVYADVKGMLSQPKLLYGVVSEMGDLILKKHPSIKAIGSHGVGGSFLVSPIMLYVYNHWFDVNGFFVRLDADGKRNPIEGFLQQGWRVLIVDTMVKTGNSSLRAHDILRAHGFEVDGMVVVVDHSHGDNACTRAGIKVESLITL
jgi:orotate phosphoribosyltransferase